MSDFESHRILTPSGQFRGLVFSLMSGRFQVKTPLSVHMATTHASISQMFESEEKLQAWVASKRWRLEKVKWFS